MWATSLASLLASPMLVVLVVFFALLIAVMLTQNTSDVNAFRALDRLEKLVGGRLEPKAILGVSVEELEEAIRPAGMHRVRARNIREVARIVCERFNCGLDFVCSLGYEEARRLLTGLPGVGLKTADVVLLVWCGHPAFPVDTHIKRIAVRLGIVDKPDYEAISRFFREGLEKEELLEVHLRLIALGRTYCRPRRPRCSVCPLRRCCSYGSDVGRRVQAGASR